MSRAYRSDSNNYGASTLQNFCGLSFLISTKSLICWISDSSTLPPMSFGLHVGDHHCLAHAIPSSLDRNRSGCVHPYIQKVRLHEGVAPSLPFLLVLSIDIHGTDRCGESHGICDWRFRS
jgi:hypothetical protein